MTVEDQPTEKEPDPRFTFANERTFLAWNRTALALVVGGLAVVQFLKIAFGGAQLIIALPLIGLGGAISYASYKLWQDNERALRRGEPLPRSILPRVLVYCVVGLGLVASALAVAQTAKG
ncbi:MAG TPA: DUF202 domain-containing protein [Solirubrobacteraceae bacterium]|jgi:putative membrane protein